MKVFNHSCQGESHRANNKPCQDASRAEIIRENKMAICIVSDGHGGEQYFRSQFGSQFLVDITFDKVQKFSDGMSDKRLLNGKPLTQIGTNSKTSFLSNEETKIDEQFRQLFRSIKAEWIIQICKHAKSVPANEWEKSHIKPQYLSRLEEQKDLEQIYGATLMAYVKTPDFWFAFHLGDGKIIMFDDEGNGSEPVIWDKDCFLNLTTSICNTDAIDRFRYTYQGDGHFPFAVFLGSDGIDDTFTDGEPLYDFYRGILQEINNTDDVRVQNYLKSDLPLLSARGSKDDMSIAYYYDEGSLEKTVNIITKQQIINGEEDFMKLYKEELTLKAAIEESERYTKGFFEEVQKAEETSKKIDKEEGCLHNDIKNLEAKKKELELEMDEKLTEIKKSYELKIIEIEESIQNKGAELQYISKQRAYYNSKDFKSKKYELINLDYKKKDLVNTERSIDSIITRMNKLRKLVGDEDLTIDDLIGIYKQKYNNPYTGISSSEADIANDNNEETTISGPNL